MFVPLMGPQRYDNESLRQSYYRRIKPGFFETLKNAIGKDLIEQGPLASAYRTGEMNDALGVGPKASDYLEGLNAQVGIPPRGLPDPSRVNTTTPISETDWKQSPDYRPGLSYMEGMTREAAKILAERYDARQTRDDVLAREPGGLVRSPVLFTARFLAMAADPLNVLSAFVPVLGDVQAARLAAQLGRVGARAVQGTVEGSVGAAVVEPLVYGAAQQDQTDYTMADSLANIGMGGLFGAGLHVGGGAVADWLRARGAKAHTAAVDVALKQAAAGQEIDVTPILRIVPEDSRTTVDVNGNRVLDTADPVARARAAERAQVDNARAQIKEQRAADAAKPMSFDERRKQAEAELLRNFPAGTVKSWKGGDVRWSGPMDIVSYIRTLGGISKEDADFYIPGGIEQYNKGRRVQFAGKENFLGPLVREGGKGLDVLAVSLRETGYLREGTVEEAIAAIDQTLRAGGDLEKRVWGDSDNSTMAVQEYADTMRTIDDEEFSAGPMPDRYEPLLAGEEDYPFEAIDLEGMDDPEAMLAAVEEAYAPRTQEPQPKGPDGKAPVDPLQAEAEAKAAAFTNAAACVARALG